MPRGRREGGALDAFFRSLRPSVLHAWTSREGYAYDRVIYAVGYPYRAGDLERVLKWSGREDDLKALPPLDALNRTLATGRYPSLAGQAPAGVSVEGWAALLHFLDPSYPLATPRAHDALLALGYRLPDAPAPAAYPAYVDALDELKEKAPVWAVPETNWYLARVLEVGLSAFPSARGARPRGAATAPSLEARLRDRGLEQGRQDVTRRARVLEESAAVHDRGGHRLDLERAGKFGEVGRPHDLDG